MRLLVFLIASIFSSSTWAEKCSVQSFVKLVDIGKCAEQGDSVAQYLLGQIYFQGKEVPKNYKKAFEWMSKAASLGDKDAQDSLGYDYYNGWGTKKDHVLAYMWWSLSIVNREDPRRVTRINLDALERELSPPELEKAQEMARVWMTKHELLHH